MFYIDYNVFYYMAKVIGLFQKHALLSWGVEGINFLSTVPVDTVWYARVDMLNSIFYDSVLMLHKTLYYFCFSRPIIKELMKKYSFLLSLLWKKWYKMATKFHDN